MASVQITPYTRIIRDEHSDVVRSWYDDTAAAQTDKAFTPRTLARGVLSDSAKLFRWDPSLPDLVDGEVLAGHNTHSVRFTQQFKGIPVDLSEIVVNLYSDSRVYSIYNNYHYDIPSDLDPRDIKVDAKQARATVERLAANYKDRELGEPRLIVYRYQNVENQPKHPQVDDRRAAFQPRYLARAREPRKRFGWGRTCSLGMSACTPIARCTTGGFWSTR